jgi:hypothetical protein
VELDVNFGQHRPKETSQKITSAIFIWLKVTTYPFYVGSMVHGFMLKSKVAILRLGVVIGAIFPVGFLLTENMTVETCVLKMTVIHLGRPRHRSGG